MREADLGQSFENFIERNSPQWGIKFGHPDGDKIMPIGDELTTDIVIIHGANVDPPIVDGKRVTKAKKVRLK